MAPVPHEITPPDQNSQANQNQHVSRRSGFWLSALKILLSAGIMTYLFVQAFDNSAFTQLWQTSKNWPVIAAGFAACFTAVMITFVRWHILNRALGMNVRFRDSLRIGFIGYLLNLAPVGGIVGGDLLKSWILASHLAKQKQTQQTQESPVSGNQVQAIMFLPESLASVFVDRLFGLYALFLLAAIALPMSPLMSIDNAIVKNVCRGTFAITIIWTVLIVSILGPDVSRGRVLRWIKRIPKFGKGLYRTILAIRLFQQRKIILMVVTALGMLVHGLFAVCLYLIGWGLFENIPSLESFLVVSPLSFSTGAIPLSIGPFEAVLDMFLPLLPMSQTAAVALPAGVGLIIALAYRIMTLITAAGGMVYYFTSRSEIRDAERQFQNTQQ